MVKSLSDWFRIHYTAFVDNKIGVLPAKFLEVLFLFLEFSHKLRYHLWLDVAVVDVFVDFILSYNGH